MSKIGDKPRSEISFFEIMDFGGKLTEWLSAVDDNEMPSDNILYEEFCHKNNIYEDDIDYFINKYEEFYQVMKRADEIQRTKIKGFAISGMIPSVVMKDILSEKSKIVRKKDKAKSKVASANKIKSAIRKSLEDKRSYSVDLEPLIEITAGNLLIYYMAKKDVENLEKSFVSETTREGNEKISVHPATKVLRDATEMTRRCLRELRLTLTTTEGGDNDEFSDLMNEVNDLK